MEEAISVDDLIERAGGVVSLAHAAEVDRVTVYGWRRRGRVPPDRAQLIQRNLGIPRSLLRPDLWEPETADGEAAE